MQVLDADSGNLKAHFRRAQALLTLGDLLEAEMDIKEGLLLVSGCFFFSISDSFPPLLFWAVAWPDLPDPPMPCPPARPSLPPRPLPCPGQALPALPSPSHALACRPVPPGPG